MEKTVFVSREDGDKKITRRRDKTAIKTPATQNMKKINKLNYKNIHLNNTSHLLFEERWRTLRQPPCRNKLVKFMPATLRTTTTCTQTNISCCISTVQRFRQQMSLGLTKQHLWLILWLFVTTLDRVHTYEMAASTYSTKGTETSSNRLYSQLLSTNEEISMHDDIKNIKEDDIFRPFVPKDPELISRSVFTPSGQFRVFQPIDTDLRLTVPMQHKKQHYDRNKMSKPLNTSLYPQHVDKQQEIMRNEKSSEENVNIKESIPHKTDLNNLSDTKHQQQHPKIKHHKKVDIEWEIKHEHIPKSNERQKHQHQQQSYDTNDIDDDLKRNEIARQDDLKTDLKSLEDLLVDYITHYFEKGHYEPTPGLLIELQNNHSQAVDQTRTVRQTSATDAEVRIDLPRTLQTGRLLFLTGLKKVLWPVFMGLQVLKSLLIAMFIPAIIGSFAKLLGKGITTGSAPLFIRPIEPPQELDFRDNTLAFEDDNKFLITDEGIKGPYAYNQPDALQMHNDYVFDPSSANNQLSFTRLGMNERQHQLMQDSYMSALQSIGSASFKNSGSLSSGSSGLLAPMAKKPPPAANINTFQQFQNVPDSSLLLSNYDPFYSPLLSRLDSVFAQLKINSDKEECREKLICLMYANPAKYAPYSNLVSAQLSRELNELRKPTSDNPDILRFFKYMRAAKDGQDGIDCEKTFDKCAEFKDFDNPAMVSTYHDINKLVQARKLPSK